MRPLPYLSIMGRLGETLVLHVRYPSLSRAEPTRDDFTIYLRISSRPDFEDFLQARSRFTTRTCIRCSMGDQCILQSEWHTSDSTAIGSALEDIPSDCVREKRSRSARSFYYPTTLSIHRRVPHP